MKLHRFLLTALLVPGFAGPSQADIVFSTLGKSAGQSAAFDSVGDPVASDFLTDDTARTITSITVNMYNSGIILNLTITLGIYEDAVDVNNGNHVPGILVGTFDSTVSVPVNGPVTGPGANYSTTTSSGINLLADTTYWVVGQAASADFGGTLYWNYNEGGGTDAGSVFSTVPDTKIMSKGPGPLGLWSAVNENPDGNLLFSLEGDITPVPEPTGLALLVTAGTFVTSRTFGWWRRRRVALDSLTDRGPAS